MDTTIVMTGATRGIGRVAAQRILKDAPGTHLVIVAREEAGGDLAAQLQADGHRVTHVAADLASMRSVKGAGDVITAMLGDGRLPSLVGFVGNAGVQYTTSMTETDDGLEATFAINVLANHALLKALEPHFAASARIVITSSDTHFGDLRHGSALVPAPAWQDPARLARVGAYPDPDSARAGRTAYSTSKLAAIYLVHEWARRLPAGVDFVAFNPSLVPGTGLAREAGWGARFAMRWILPLMTLTPLASTQSSAGKDLSDVVLGHTPARTGEYVDRRHVVPSSDESYDPEREAALWDALESILTAASRS